jgi:drug/metabolite transporter (DMT)-like permease
VIRSGVLAGWARPIPPPWLPIAAALTTVLLWASAFVAIRHVGREISAGPLALGRLLVGSAVLGAIAAFRNRARTGRRWPIGRDWIPLLACGVLWFGLYNVALNAAERRIDAGTAAMVINVGPLLMALLAGVLLGEGFPRRLLLGSAVAFGGVLVIGAASSSHSAQGVGVLLCVLAAVSYAIAVVAQKPLLARLPALEVTWLACTVGAVCCLPFLPRLISDVGAAAPATVAWVVYLGAFPTALAFTTWAYALSHTTAGRMGATTYLVPPLVVLIGWLGLGESPPRLVFAGGALCLAGVYLARRAPRRPPTRQPEIEPGRIGPSPNRGWLPQTRRSDASR